MLCGQPDSKKDAKMKKGGMFFDNNLTFYNTSGTMKYAPALVQMRHLKVPTNTGVSEAIRSTYKSVHKY